MGVAPVSGFVLVLWRAALVFRLVGLVLACYLIVRWRHLYAVPGAAFGVGAGMILLTAAMWSIGWRGRAHRRGLVALDLALTAGLTLLTRAAQHSSQYRGTMPTLTTFWAAGPVIEAGILLAVAGGLAAAVIQFAATVVVRQGVDLGQGFDGRTLLNGFLLLVVGGIAGYMTVLGTRVEQERADLAAERARLAERERLTRSIHDGVLQVLALVHRRGRSAGPDWAELAEEAAAQEAALRALITSGAHPTPPSGSRDLVTELAALRSARVHVAGPDEPVLLQAQVAGELIDAVAAALRNVELHAGPGATAWILLEQLPDRIVLSVRDDGLGMAPGRLEQAAADGRIGVARSIRGRVAELGGTLAVTSAPGVGTELEIEIPLYG